MSAVRTFLLGLNEQRQQDRRRPGLTATPQEAEEFIREGKYTGWYITHCNEGVPIRIQFPNPMQITLSR